MRSQCTVRFEDPFWVGFFELWDDTVYSVCRIVFGKEPKISELCKICSLSAEEITECIDASRPVCSISAPLREDESMSPEDTASDEDIFSPLVDRLALNQTLCELCDFDRQLIFLRYYKSLTQIQTAKILGISQVSVSRNEKRILSYLRQKLVI